jgi:hypothetical protein
MKQTAVEFLVDKFSIQGTLHSSDISQAKEMEKQQQDEFAIGFADWKDENCIYYDGWNIRVPLGDKYNDVYTNEELLEIYKKEKEL